MPHIFWVEVVSTATCIMNKTSTMAIRDVTPEERCTDKKPDLSHLKVFGCIAYVHVPDELCTKLDPRWRNVFSLYIPLSKRDSDVIILLHKNCA